MPSATTYANAVWTYATRTLDPTAPEDSGNAYVEAIWAHTPRTLEVVKPMPVTVPLGGNSVVTYMEEGETYLAMADASDTFVDKSHREKLYLGEIGLAVYTDGRNYVPAVIDVENVIQSTEMPLGDLLVAIGTVGARSYLMYLGGEGDGVVAEFMVVG